MTSGGDIVRGPVSKALSADFISVMEPGLTFGATFLQAWKWLTRSSRGVLARGVSRRLRVAETVSLGEKRFISILRVDGEQFLVGGSRPTLPLSETEEKSKLPEQNRLRPSSRGRSLVLEWTRRTARVRPR